MISYLVPGYTFWAPDGNTARGREQRTRGSACFVSPFIPPPPPKPPPPPLSPPYSRPPYDIALLGPAPRSRFQSGRPRANYMLLPIYEVSTKRNLKQAVTKEIGTDRFAGLADPSLALLQKARLQKCVLGSLEASVLKNNGFP